MIKLLVKFGNESKEIELHESEISIGRATDNVLPLQDKKSSRKHAKIEKINDEYRVNDLGSGNGTKVNGSDVNTKVLAKGDEIVIGLTTIFVIALDTPVKAAAAPPPPAAVAASPAPTARAEEKPAESAVDARRKQTRRALARSGGSGWIGTAASVLVLIGIGGAGVYYYNQNEKAKAAKAELAAIEANKSTQKYRDAELAYNKFRKTAEADPVEDSIITQATALADEYAALYPAFDTMVSSLKQRRSEQLGKEDLASVDTRVQNALRERRYGDALQALKDMKAGSDTSAAGGLVAKVCDTINAEFKSVEDRGRKLADEKKYSVAADHYRLEAPRFKGTEHYLYLMYKPETLDQLRKAEAETAIAKGKPAETEKPDTSIAKAETPAPKPEPVMPKPEPVMPKPEPAMPKPEPAMPKPEPAKPAPAMPKPEPAKPAPKPPPPPPPPAPEKKEEEKKEDIGTNLKGFKKPEVLCDCKKIIKGVYCLKCDRMLATEDMRNGVCKRCEEKPKKIDLCSKKYYMVDGQPDKRSEKPILFEGKLYDFAYEDKARIVYLCDGCQEAADSSGEVKHKPDCASKTVVKVCSKSGTPPHGGEKK